MEQVSFLLLLAFRNSLFIILLTYSFLALKLLDIRMFFLLFIITFSSFILRTLPIIPLVIIISSMLIHVVYFKYIYKMPIYISAISTGLSVLIYFFIEGIIMPFLINISNLTYLDFYSNSLITLKFVSVQVIILTILIIFIRHFKIDLSEQLKFFKVEELEIITDSELDFRREKRVTTAFIFVIIFIVLQGIFINIYILNEKFTTFFTVHYFFTSATFVYLLIIFLNIILLYLLYYMFRTMRLERNDIILRIKEKNALRLDWEKRAQMHDRNHHLHMLYMLLQMNNVERAKEYLKGMVGEIQNIEARVRCGNQALNALIRSKMARGKQVGVYVDLEVENKLGEMQIQDWELNRIIGNLLDNAIEAVEKEQEKMNVKLIINNVENYNIFEVITYGIVISNEVEANIFKKGYSNKKEKGHGLGLAICKELVDEYGGNIKIEKDFEKVYTSFKVFLPYKNK
ncbi:sensor histidine kinase [Natronospora cellulosivora (SeqCode)]